MFFQLASTFQSCISLIGAWHTGKYITCLLADTQLDPRRSRAVRKLICCGQIVCRGEKCELLSGCCGPHMSHLYLSQHPQTAAALTAGRERPLAGNFTPPLLHVFPPLDNFLHAFLVDVFFLPFF